MLFFSWIAWGNLQQQQKKSVLVLFISFFWRGRFGTAAESAAGFYLALTHSLTLSFFPGRASLEDGREERKERGEKGSIRYFPTISFSASEREKRRTFREAGRKSIGFFVFIYFYIFMFYIYIYIYYLVVFSCCVDRERREKRREEGRRRGGEETEEAREETDRERKRQKNKKIQYTR